MVSLRKSLASAAAAAAALTVIGSAPASASPADASYAVSVGSPVRFAHPTDTPPSTYVDKDGTFHYQQSAALYGSTEPREWDFYTGTNFDTATFSSAISKSVNPANPQDRNDDTTWRCNNSPTGQEATYAPAGSGYSQKNYCDLSGVWVDPDTGDWYGLVHNEFTPQPFGDGLHYDAIDYAVSTDQGRTWTIKGHAITSPFSTERGDTAAFPNQTYYYGDGDQRLFVDTASGYFYAFYGSRVVDKGGSWRAFYSHVARAPISGKMATGTWQKWYDGHWSQPGVGGKESNMVPVDSADPTGYTPPDEEYDPANTGTASQQIAAGKMPPTSPLFVMNVTYDAYLGLYIGEPQAVDQSGNAPQQFYATDDLATQKWRLIGDTGSYHNASWYRWFLDSANKTSMGIVGKDFRSYCSFGCSKYSGEYVDVTIDSSAPATPVDAGSAYQIAGGEGRVLAQVSGTSATTSVTPGTSRLASWVFEPEGDGSYRIVNAGTGALLGVDATGTAGRAWGTKPTVEPAPSSGATVRQQWFVIPDKSSSGALTRTYRLVNRYSGLVLALSDHSGRLAETTPVRSWTDTTGNAVGGSRRATEQTLRLIPAVPAGPAG
ncbi:MAG TPA: RICIN domain-containing protein [Streptosporangiales bacterium]